MKIYTIGHSTREIKEFISLLQTYKIERLVDIRSFPHSKYVPQYNQDNLKKSLEDNSIDYIHLKALGGKRGITVPEKESINTGWTHKSFRNYADYMQTEDYKLGIEALIKLSKLNTTCIMCAEAVPWKCHRKLVSDSLLIHGIEVIDIMSLIKSQPHILPTFARVDAFKNITYPKWNLTSEILPKIDSNIETSEDGITVGETMDYLSHRQCILAGIGGGNGYFGEGFATDGSTGCDSGLILDPPKYWRY
jgi:uncharacterized protein (DUF488 family)